jgi:hypothetical protein
MCGGYWTSWNLMCEEPLAFVLPADHNRCRPSSSNGAKEASVSGAISFRAGAPANAMVHRHHKGSETP